MDHTDIVDEVDPQEIPDTMRSVEVGVEPYETIQLAQQNRGRRIDDERSSVRTLLRLVGSLNNGLPKKGTPCKFEQMQTHLNHLNVGCIVLRKLPADGDCLAHAFYDFGDTTFIRQASFFAHAMDPDLVRSMLMETDGATVEGILCIDEQGCRRPAASSVDWLGPSSIVALLRVLDGLDLVIVVTLPDTSDTSSPYNRGYGVRFNVYIASPAVSPLSRRSVDDCHNASIAFVRNAIDNSQGFKVLGLANNHYGVFTGFRRSPVNQSGRRRLRRKRPLPT